jgi:heptosyltransferase-2
MKRKILIVELWGLGDLSFSTPLIAAALANGDEVHLVGKGHARTLLEPTFPAVRFHEYDAPWTAYRGKYRLWKWGWTGMASLVLRLRREKFDIAVSVRNDPRDPLFIWLAGAKQRVGFAFEIVGKTFDTSKIFLTRALKREKPKQHKVEDWRQIAAAIGLPEAAAIEPQLEKERYRTERVDRIFRSISKPVVCLHAGARIEVRRWPEKNFLEIIARLREQFDFHLIVIPEPLSLPSLLAEVANTFLTDLTLTELVDVLGRSDILICNDSGPAHIAACCGRPVIPFFGPSDADWFRPWGPLHKVIQRDFCSWRPCFDYCHFPKPYCMTRLRPEIVWQEIECHIRSLIEDGALTNLLLKNNAPQPAATIP